MARLRAHSFVFPHPPLPDCSIYTPTFNWLNAPHSALVIMESIVCCFRAHPPSQLILDFPFRLGLVFRVEKPLGFYPSLSLGYCLKISYILLLPFSWHWTTEYIESNLVPKECKEDCKILNPKHKLWKMGLSSMSLENHVRAYDIQNFTQKPVVDHLDKALRLTIGTRVTFSRT